MTIVIIIVIILSLCILFHSKTDKSEKVVLKYRFAMVLSEKYKNAEKHSYLKSNPLLEEYGIYCLPDFKGTYIKVSEWFNNTVSLSKATTIKINFPKKNIGNIELVIRRSSTKGKYERAHIEYRTKNPFLHIEDKLNITKYDLSILQETHAESEGALEYFKIGSWESLFHHGAGVNKKSDHLFGMEFYVKYNVVSRTSELPDT